MDVFTSAGGVLLNHENKIFLTHKIVRDEWSLPKGGQKEGETLVQTAKREIEEETGFKNIELVSEEQIGHDYFEFLNPKTNKQSGKHVYFYVFRASDENQTHTPEMDKEGFEGKWMDFDEALKLIAFENVKTVVENARKLVNKLEKATLN